MLRKIICPRKNKVRILLTCLLFAVVVFVALYMAWRVLLPYISKRRYIRQLNSPVGALRVEAIRVLCRPHARRFGPQIEPVVKALKTESDSYVRARGVRSLASADIDYDYMPLTKKLIQEVLIYLLHNDPSPEVRWAVVASLWHNPLLWNKDVLAALIKALERPDERHKVIYLITEVLEYYTLEDSGMVKVIPGVTPEEQRGLAISKWKKWWNENKSIIEWNPKRQIFEVVEGSKEGKKRGD